ncbi:hypothetical protein HDU96_001855 [Phlyctochytrium bullatum]|nr:hypothetical protein HDU96_001855 [Phlyctochytrium bullatum]
MVKSHRRPYKNILCATLVKLQLSTLELPAEVRRTVPRNRRHLAFEGENNDFFHTSLEAPRKSFCLSPYERNKLEDYFLEENIPFEELPDRVFKYSRLIIGQLRVFGSSFAQEKRKQSEMRDNSCVAVSFGGGVRKSFIRAGFGYGRVKYYVALDAPVSSKLAFIHWAKKPTVDEYGVFQFNGYGEHSFVDVGSVDRSVGFVPVEGSTVKFELIDREVTPQ